MAPAGFAARLLAVCLALVAVAVRAEPDPAQTTEALRRATETLEAVGRHQVAGEWILSADTLPRVYAKAGFRLLWTDPGSAEGLLGEVAASEGDGLTPSDYHFEVLRAAMERRRAGPDDVAAAVEADLLLTDALIRMVAHLRLGKLHPDHEPRWDLPARVGDEDAVALVSRLVSGGQLALQLSDLRPAHPIYGRLKAALARYRLMAAESGWPFIGPGPVLKVGVTDTRVATVRRRLTLTGDYLGEPSDSPVYDASVMSAVQNFQRRHSLETDGVLGPATRAALNEPVEGRIGEIRANLERARQLLHGVRGRFLLIDPAAGLVTAARDSAPADVQQAIFGPGFTELPVFRSTLSHVIVNPDWVLPAAMVSEQIAPLARKNAGRLEALGISLLSPDGHRLGPDQVDWARPAGVLVRQYPGEGSFLGSGRLAFPNPYGVTVHGRAASDDTPEGVVSIPDPLAIAALFLGPLVDREALEEIASSGRTRTVPVEVPVAVLVAPWTAWAASDGSVSFRPGFKATDQQVVAGLTAGPR